METPCLRLPAAFFCSNESCDVKEPIGRGPLENVVVVQFHIFPKNMASSSSFVVETSEQISEISNEKLMDCIRNYRSIYDKKCKDYKVPQKKKNAWKEVSAQLGIDIDEAQRRYNSIRTNFAVSTVSKLPCNFLPIFFFLGGRKKSFIQSIPNSIACFFYYLANCRFS